MSAKGVRQVPDLTTSSLVHAGGHLFVDSATGMVVSRVGHVKPIGYEYAVIDGRERTTHRFIWETLHGPIPEGLTINHLDGDKANNRPDNLELATQSEQVSHAYRTGLRVGNGLAGRWRGSRISDEQHRSDQGGSERNDHGASA